MRIRMTMALLITILTAPLAQAAPLSTAFTYQGQLKDAGAPADGLHDLRFRLYDALSGGALVGSVVCLDNVNVTDGLFAVPLDFGAQFAGEQRFLEIDVRADSGLTCVNATGFTTLAPRQALTAAPNALFSLDTDRLEGLASTDFLRSTLPLSLSAPSNTHVLLVQNPTNSSGAVALRGETTGAISLGNAGVFGQSTGVLGTGVYGDATSTGAAGGFGVQGHTASTTGSGVFGKANSLTGDTYGVRGESVSPTGRGVFGNATATTGSATGVVGQSASTFGRGVVGWATATTGATNGGLFQNDSTSGRGLFSTATAATGTTYGGQFQTNSTSGYGIHSRATAGSGTNYGVYGQSDSTSGRGVYGYVSAVSGNTYGVRGESDSPSGRGVYGYATSETGTNFGVFGVTDSADGYAGYFIGGRNYFSGSVGIGTPSPERALDVRGRIRLRQDTPASSGNSAGIDFYQQTPAEDRAFIGMRDDNQFGLYGRAGSGWSFVMDVATGNVGIGTTSPQAKLHVNGTTRCDVLEITGADLAEKFPVSDETRPGLVMEIDPENAGKLRVARGEYNRRVAGVISGANGLSAGTILGHLPGSEDAPPVALSGRVWVYADASREAIEVGDLLTTSSTPGHAMKAVDYARAQGAAIGKAMTALPCGEVGYVLVLVNLQ